MSIQGNLIFLKIFLKLFPLNLTICNTAFNYYYSVLPTLPSSHATVRLGNRQFPIIRRRAIKSNKSTNSGTTSCTIEIHSALSVANAVF